MFRNAEAGTSSFVKDGPVHEREFGQGGVLVIVKNKRVVACKKCSRRGTLAGYVVAVVV